MPIMQERLYPWGCKGIHRQVMNARTQNTPETVPDHQEAERRRRRPRRITRILLVDDEPCYRGMVKMILQHFMGVRVTEAATSRQALAVARHRRLNLVISDIVRPGTMDGLLFLKVLKEQHPQIPVLIASGNATPVNRYEAIWSGAYTFLPKPFSVEELLAAVREGLQGARQCRTLRLLARYDRKMR